MASRLGIISAYSLLYGVLMPGAILEACRAHEISTIAITDIAGIHGLHAFREEAEEYGVTIITATKFITPQGPLWAFVSSAQGYARLTHILSSQVRGADVIEALASDSRGLILASSSRPILTRLKSCSENLYAAITPGNLGGCSYGSALSLPLAAIEDALFIEKKDYDTHRLLCAIAQKKTLGSLDESLLASPDAVIHSEGEYQRIFSPWPDALEGTERIAQQCSFSGLFSSLIFPSYHTLDTAHSAETLRERVFAGAHIRYGELNDAIIDRIEWELSIVTRKGFAPYFLIMHDIVTMASRSCGRGSAAASIISYALGITQVDPIAYNLYFERFLTSSREDMPDIDVDFAWDERDEILHQVMERFTVNHCARVANHNLFRFRSAVRESAKAHGLSDAQITQALNGRNQLIEHQSVWNSVLNLAQNITGLPRSLSMHCGGLVITPHPIDTYAHVVLSREGYPLLTWEKEGVESAGLVKIDLLGNRSLAVIRDTLADLEKAGISIDRDSWRPAEDEATIELIARGDTMGVFYIESPAMRLLQKKTGKGDFEHIVIHSSLIRPAANAYIEEYVRRVHGSTWEPVHPLFEQIVQESYGIMCYQEDVSKTAIVLAGFSEHDGDQLRKVVAKKHKHKRLAAYEKQFEEGCRSHGITQDVRERIWSMILSFDGYSFCKPHSASYAMVSFQSAYLRVHHPAPFMAAVLSNRGGFYSEGAYISEARRMGLELRGPDINESVYRYQGAKHHLIVGFMAIRDLSYRSVQTILAERQKEGAFTSLEDISERITLPHTDIAVLASAGVFDSIAGNADREEQVRSLLINGKRAKGREPELFQQSVQTVQIKPRGRKDRTEELLSEYRALGFLRKHHILFLWAYELSRIRRIRGYEIPGHEGQQVTLAGWPVTKRTIITKQKHAMAFVSFEDETCIYEAVIFPQVHERYESLIYASRPLIVRGIVKRCHQAFSIEVTSLSALT